MKLLFALMLIGFSIFLPAGYCLARMAEENAAATIEVTAAQQTKAIRVYMIQDTGKDVWYLRTRFVSWTSQDRATVWTSKQEAQLAKDALFSKRVTVIRVFLLLPTQDKDK